MAPLFRRPRALPLQKPDILFQPVFVDENYEQTSALTDNECKASLVIPNFDMPFHTVGKNAAKFDQGGKT